MNLLKPSPRAGVNPIHLAVRLALASLTLAGLPAHAAEPANTEPANAEQVTTEKLATTANAVAANAASARDDTLPEVQVTDQRADQAASEKTRSYTINNTSSATRLNTSLKETPQSISVITRQQIEDFKLNNINDVLDFATGIQVERVEPERSYYTARGSDVTNFQIDGIGTPFPLGLVFGDIDTAVYDRVEVLRGANGLLTGTGNPSATINLIRKRPTAEFQAKVAVAAGSWDQRRLDADVSGPLNASGTVRGRLVLANLNRDSYLDRYEVERNVAYGIIEADLSESTTLAFGHTYQRHNGKGNMWGSLPLLYADGSLRPYSRSDSTAPDWSYWDTLTNISFAELTHFFENDWKLKTQLTRKEINSDSRLLYVFGNQDKATGTGLAAQAGMYRDATKELIADAYLSGPFTLGGRQHELVLGSSWSRSDSTEVEKFGGVFSYPSFDSIAEQPLPTFVASGNFADIRVKRFNSYIASKWNVSDALKLTAGANMLSYKLEGESYGAPQEAEANSKITPYLGAVYHLNPVHALYASYTSIYNPQILQDINFKPLAPIQGNNYEAGVKSEFFERRLNTSFALFRNVQENVAQFAGAIGPRSYYTGIDADTRGYEFDFSGEVTPRLKVSGGYTRLMSVEDAGGDNVKPYIPRDVVHLSGVYRVPALDKLRVGASVRWQADTHADIALAGVGNVRYKQDSYALVNLLASYEIDKHWSAAINAYNVTNEKHLASMMWANYGQGYYAPPRSAMFTLTWKY
ncbi:TonB-dependent siderophore receptor [Methylobacillus flagellatus]|uniref:TonB-dependent siderophore receptor n=1 Tax=Methylobacillus flagellatus TaxID=405 RepID=UPI0025706DD7|nr:TonB-dependent siderophore receptor [Methylobacillus flagellatus]